MKTWKNLIVPAVILAVLIAGYLVYKFALTDTADLQATAADSGTSGTVSYAINIQTGDIAAIHVTKKDGTGFSVVSSLDDAGAAGWNFSSDSEEISGYGFSQESLSAFVSRISSAQAVAAITDAKDSLTEYGLDDPAYKVDFTLVSGQKHVLLLGNTTFDGSNVYCTLDDTGIVSTVDLQVEEACDASLIDFVDLKITDTDKNDVASVSFRRAHDNIDVTAAGSQVPGDDGTSAVFTWEFTKPFSIPAGTVFETLADEVLALSAANYVDLHPADYAVYGLDSPAYTFDILLTDGSEKQIDISSDRGGVYYGTCTGSPAVFSLNTSALTGLETSLPNLIDPRLADDLISGVKNIEASFPEGIISMDIDIAADGSISDADSVARVNGINAKVTDREGRSYFELLFESIEGISVTGFDFDAKPQDTRDISIIITGKNSTQKIIDLAVKDENTYYAFIDGEYFGFLVSKAEIYKDNGSYLYSYGAWAAYNRLIEAISGDEGSGIYVISDS